jgi:hypothetical protein
MAAPTTAAHVKKSLANPEPSTHGVMWAAAPAHRCREVSSDRQARTVSGAACTPGMQARMALYKGL